jgi:hypothetical protein
LSKALADPGRVLVDVSGLRVSSSAAVQVFPSVLAGAGGWPAARLGLFGRRGAGQNVDRVAGDRDGAAGRRRERRVAVAGPAPTRPGPTP